MAHSRQNMLKWFMRKALRPSVPDRAGVDVALATNEGIAAETFKNRGNDHFAKGEFAAAAECYQQAIAVDPVYAHAYNNLGLVLLQQGRADEAMAHFRHALSLDPQLAQAHMNCGNVLWQKGLTSEAIHSFRAALLLNPKLSEAHNNLGALLKIQGLADSALACFQKAVRLNPDLAEAHYNIGDLLQEQGRLNEAVTCFQDAIRLKPDFAESFNSLGIVFRELGRHDQARVCFEKALTLKPDFSKAQNNLGTLALDRGDQEAAYACFWKALHLDPAYAEAHSNFLFAAQYDPSYSSANLFAEHVRFGERFEKPLRPQWPVHKNLRQAGRRLRIGFVSGDLCSHPVGFFMENVLAHLDRQALDITLYPTQHKSDTLSRRLENLDVAWHPLFGLSDEQAAQRIAEESIDILVDLSGHTAGNRLLIFARKPAPIQVSWLYFSTTGLHALDYLLCDRHVVPPQEAGHFIEKPYYLPDSYLCFTPPSDDVPIGPLPALENRHVTFGCFNNLVKMNDRVVRLWARVLHAVPNSRLFLKAGQLNDASIQETTRKRFGAHGIDPGRLTLEGLSPRIEYLSRYNDIDIALDPFPFPGGTTTVEALWMSVPVLSRAGDRFISRAGESILQTAGLPDWIAADDDDYVDKAKFFADDLQTLAAVRAGLRARFVASPLCDGQRFARNLETAFREMWLSFVRQPDA